MFIFRKCIISSKLTVYALTTKPNYQKIKPENVYRSLFASYTSPDMFYYAANKSKVTNVPFETIVDKSTVLLKK